MKNLSVSQTAGGGVKWKKCFIGLLSLCALALVPCASHADSVEASKNNSVVFIDGESEYFDAYLIHDNNYFKLRDIAYVLDGSGKQFDVQWNEQTNSIDLVPGKGYTAVGGEMEQNADGLTPLAAPGSSTIPLDGNSSYLIEASESEQENTYYFYTVDGLTELDSVVKIDSPAMNRYAQRPVAVPTASSIYLNGQPIKLTAYNINNNNYFKLRDLGDALDFSVEWNERRQHIEIETAYDYSEAGEDSYAMRRNVDITNTTHGNTSNWARLSPVQQFKYMNEGLAYAYNEAELLHIVTPHDHFQIEMKYPLLGDVISDDEGNFYVVWGKENETDDPSVETTFISKYSKDGQHVKSTGFVGASSPWDGDDSANTKNPFSSGNSVSVIKDHILLNYHGKGRYDGHQCDGVIGVDIRTMAKIDLENNAFSGHSFNQRVIYSEMADDFIFASHGDAYSRGFRINNSAGLYGDDDEVIFHFYLEANAGYNMFVVNRTFAQLGGLLETGDGVVLVGASAKSISEKAKEEKQNLFVQVFDPNSESVSRSMFVGGEERSGATSFDIYDNQNSPLTPVTDYGVHWLTDNKDFDVVAPHAVAAEDRIVILWTEMKGIMPEAYYTVLSSAGETITPPTSLGVGRQLNSNEDPIYHDGTIYWASAYNGRIRVDSIALDEGLN